MKVLSAMSGGVDSAVATARMIRAGHQVSAVHLSLSNSELAGRGGVRGCSSPKDTQDAKLVADKLGIDFEVWDFSDRFADNVVKYFLSEYDAGRTPNPCLRCNEKIKFAALIERGIELGFDLVATGHYAQVVNKGDHVELIRATDIAKDQSYVLGGLSQEQLSHCVFPLGDSFKPDVRAEAKELGFEVASKPDSVDICFISDGDTSGYLNEKLGVKPGIIVDTEGNQLGSYDGTHRFTIGQRKGLNLGVPAVDGKPRYVVELDPDNNRVVVGGAAALSVTGFDGIRPRWTWHQPADQWRGYVQIRAHGKPMPAVIRFNGDDIHVDFDEPQRAIAPGQYAVFYDDQRVLGSVIVNKTNRFNPVANS